MAVIFIQDFGMAWQQVQKGERYVSVFENLKMNYVVSAIVCIVFGLTLVIWPDISSKVVCIGVGIVLLLSGIANLITYFGEKDRNLMTQISLIAGIILAVLGGWIILNPQILIMVIPVVMGVIVAVHGVHNLLQALELFKNEYSKWWVALLLGAVTVGLGVLLIFNPFEAVNTVIMLIGIFLIYDGISDLWIISRVSKTAREIRETVEALDVTDKSE